MCKYCKNCNTCQCFKSNTCKVAELYALLSVPELLWQQIHIGFVSELPQDNRHMMVIACVDYFIKMVQLVLLQESNAQTMANMFLSTVVSYCGLLDFITSDHDPRFFGHFWNELMSLFDTTFNLVQLRNLKLTGYLR